MEMDGEGDTLAGPQHTELALPAEVWYEVAMWLDPKSLACLSLVSRFFGLGVCRQPSIWRHLFRRELVSRQHPGVAAHKMMKAHRKRGKVGSGPGSLRYWQRALRCLVVPSVGRVDHAFVKWPIGEGHYVVRASSSRPATLHPLS
jgi:hypothetical protein